ncbi:MAG: YggU family protein [Verrucomicrobia bacterium Tous-C9LFEB]|nr:MAG: YggU family protein [Verrucomicrobia bacterium Tous-C9LFEB]
MTNNPSPQYITLHVVPNAPKSAIVGRHGTAIKVKLHAPAVDNKANAELVRFLAEQLDLPASAVTLVRGQKSREKTVALSTLTVAQAEALLLGETKT